MRVLNIITLNSMAGISQVIRFGERLKNRMNMLIWCVCVCVDSMNKVENTSIAGMLT